ncbi:MAG: peptidylprolyl isomerase [Pyrinomonadaceae bacterium]
MNKYLFLFLLIVSVFAFACPKSASDVGAAPTVKRDVKPVADKEIAIIEMENAAAYGPITLELYSNIAPEMVARFKELAKSGFYNGVAFHRISQDVIQAGDPNSKDNDPSNDGAGGSDKEDVPAEFSDIPFEPGILGAARMGSDVNSANSQFFIMRTRQPQFDYKYTVFGKVIEGMGNVSVIAGNKAPGERPLDKIIIKTIRIEEKK